MDYDEYNEDDLDGVENLVNKKDNNELKCKSKYIIFIIIGNLILICLCIIVVHLVSKPKVNIISDLFNDYLKDMTKMAITSNRVKHLVKTNSPDKYQVLVDLEKEILNTTWERINLKNKTAIRALDDLISKFLFPEDEIHYGISEGLVKILTQKVDYRIYQLLDTDPIKILNTKLFEKKNYDEKILTENKLKAVILYGLINFPLQITYFSKNSEIKKDLIDVVIKKLNPEEIENTINQKMEKYDNNNNNLYMVLGAGQKEEKKRISIKVKNATFINLIDTGLRIISTNDEIKETFKNSFENYYINTAYKDLMMACSAEEMTEENYKKFKDESQNYIFEEYTSDNMKKINEYLNNYTFSVETANTIVEYIKLNVPLEKIHIIQLGYKYRHQLINEPLKYDENDVYILYNVYDISLSSDNIKRATTESNVKAIYYLKDEYPNFLNEDDYNKFILVSSQGYAERQLEAFNIISNIYKYNFKFDGVIWNEEYSEALDGETIIAYILEIVVKSTNLISTSFVKVNNFSNEIQYFAQKALNLADKYK